MNILYLLLKIVGSVEKLRYYLTKKQFTHKSWSTTIVNERIDIINFTIKNSNILDIEDIKNAGAALGTKVVLKFKIK